MPDFLVIPIVMGCLMAWILFVFVLDTVLHELGHAMAALALSPAPVEIVIGAFQVPEHAFRMRLGRLSVRFTRNPFYWIRGVCRHHATDGIRKQIVVTAAGPFVSLLLLISALTIFITNPNGGLILPASGLAAIAVFLRLFFNLMTRRKVVFMEGDAPVFNDGRSILDKLAWLRSVRAVVKAEKLISANDIPATEHILARLERDRATAPQFLRAVAMTHLNRGDFASCRRILEKQIADGVELNVQETTVLGHARMYSGDYEAAVECYQRVVMAGSQDDVIVNNLGFALNALERYEEAVTVLRTRIDAGSTFSYHYGNRAYARIMSGDPAGGMLDMEECLRLEPRPSHGYDHRNKGAYLLKRGDPVSALIELGKAHATDARIPGLDALMREAKMQIDERS